MLGPAVNRQPGFRRGLVEQSNATKNNPTGWLSVCLPGWLAGWLGLSRLAGWLAQAGWLMQDRWLALGRKATLTG